MADNLKDIAAELKVIRKVLERMTQAPIFNKNDGIFYLCDGNACHECYDGCQHTKDITHAKNFMLVQDAYFESPQENQTL